METYNGMSGKQLAAWRRENRRKMYEELKANSIGTPLSAEEKERGKEILRKLIGDALLHKCEKTPS